MSTYALPNPMPRMRRILVTVCLPGLALLSLAATGCATNRGPEQTAPPASYDDSASAQPAAQRNRPAGEATARADWARDASHVSMEVHLGTVPAEHARDHR